MNDQYVKSSFIALCQRKPELMNRPFLYHHTMRVFGNPLLIRVADLEGFTGHDFYDYVAKRLQAHVTPAVLPFLTPEQSIDHDNITGQLGMRRRREECQKSYAHCTEETAFCEIPRYGFRLRVTARDGKKCDACPWFDSCIGSLIPDDDYPTIVADGDTVSIDWHIAVDVTTDSFGRLIPHDNQLNIWAKLTNSVRRHHSCHDVKNRCGKGSITLDECLQAFSMEEKIPEVSQLYYLLSKIAQSIK